MAGKGKNSGPFLRGQRGRYYCWIEGRLLSLGTDKPRVAEGRYNEKLKSYRAERERELRREAPAPPTVRECLDAYLESCRGYKDRGHARRESYFADFCAATGAGDGPWDGIDAGAAEAWLATHPNWSPSSRATAIRSLRAAFNFCVRRGRIAASPLKGLERPPFRRRREVIGPKDEVELFSLASGPFLAILTALRETGARPSELCRATVADYRDGAITLHEHKTDGHAGAVPRVIYLTPALRVEVEKLIAGRDSGPIWRNGAGRAWTPDSIYARFYRLRKKHPELGEGVFPYAFRSKFASDAINNKNANPAMVARLLGHADLEMLMKHYFRENPEAAIKTLEEIRKPKEEDQG